MTLLPTKRALGAVMMGTVLVLTAAPTGMSTAAASAPLAPLVNSDVPTAVDGAYIVVLSPDSTTAAVESAATAASAAGGKITHRFASALIGFAADLPAAALDAVRRTAGVAYVEQDTVASFAAPVRTGGSQEGPTWGLDRIDQRRRPYDDTYRWRFDGTGVSVYVVNTGIRFSHDEFEGRAITGPDFYQPDKDSSDCAGFGTHAAATIGGKTYGVAKGATLVALRVTNCDAEGVVSDTIAAIDWVVANAQGPSVITTGGQFAISETLNDAVAAAADLGIVTAVPAGDFAQNSCVLSPAQEPTAVTVAASDFDDTEAVFTSFGPCVDIYAPGVNTVSAWYGADDATAIITGTESAAAHTAGALAKLVQKYPGAPAERISHKLVKRSTRDRLSDVTPGTPNKLLYSRKY